MEEKHGSSVSVGGGGGKSTKQLAIEGQKLLEETIQAAHQILTAMNDELCNPALWATSSPAPSGSDQHDASQQPEPGGGALEEARFRYKSTVTALRAVITAITNTEAMIWRLTGLLRNAASAEEWGEMKSVWERVINTMMKQGNKANQNESGSMTGTSEPKSDSVEIQNLEEQAAELKKEIATKNRYLNVLMDQLRELIADISMWQSPRSS